MHVQRFGYIKELLPFQFFQLFQCPPVHLVIVEPPAGSSGIPCFLQIFPGFIMSHAKLFRILPELTVVIAAGCTLEISVKTIRLHASEKRRFISSVHIPVKEQLGAEGSVQAFRCGYGRRIIMIDTRVLLYKRVKIRRGLRRNVLIIKMNVIPVHRLQDQHNNPVIGRRGQRLGRLFPHNSQFVHPFFIFFRQFLFLMLGSLNHLFFVKRRLAYNIHGNGRHQHVPVFLTAFFNLLFAPKTGFM